MIKCVVFDFDHTLFDSKKLDKLRQARKWNDIEKELPKYSFHQGAIELIRELRGKNISVAIFSNAPKHYIEQALSIHQVSVDYIVAYHDVTKHKPDPEGLFKVLKQSRCSTREIVYVGDGDIDQDASKKANILFYGVEWGSFTDKNTQVVTFQNLISVLFDGQSAKRAGDIETAGINDPYQLDGITSYTTENLVINEENKYYLGYYKDPIRQKIFDFKDNRDKGVQAWLSVLHDNLQLLPKVDYIVRALGHDETQMHETALDLAGRLIAEEMNAEYIPDLLKKTKSTPKSTGMGAQERKDAIKGVYEVNQEHQTYAELAQYKKRILIIDDVYTTGSTTNEISRSLRTYFPQIEIYIFTLVQTRGFSDTAEMKYHNVQLYKMLELAGRGVAKTHKVYDKKLYLSKSFSANYSYTNHNFIIQNLFNYSIKSDPKNLQLLPSIYILKNILQRGKPTLMSKYLQEHMGPLHKNNGFYEASPLIDTNPVTWKRVIKGHEETKNHAAKYFFEKLVPKYFGEYAFVQNLMLPEVSFYDITRVYDVDLYEKMVDFYLPQAYLIIEIDGAQHKDKIYEDALRDAHTMQYGIETVRINVSDLKAENNAFKNQIQLILDRIARYESIGNQRKSLEPSFISLGDYKNAVVQETDWQAPTYVAAAIIRMQLLLLELLQNDTLSIDREWRLEIRQHDVQGFAELAVEDTMLWLHHISKLHGIKIDKPRYSIQYLNAGEPFSSGESVKIDFSLAKRYCDEFQENNDILYVRTHYLDEYQFYPTDDSVDLDNVIYQQYDFFTMSTLESIKYSLSLDGEGSDKISLLFLLENIFLQQVEDVDFREGQLGIITNALMGNDTVGLLPTGSGKSVCYQLAAILQPAISFVVCPIKSLMYDQKADLDSVFFSRTNYITSDLKPYEKSRVQKEFAAGKYFFIFISPERFQSKAFREDFASINQEKAFAYAVIDEVHCLSEWGHDFRTSYLNLSNAIEKFAPDSTYIGLTATASVNVLRDIQTEFKISDIDVKTPLDYTRKELDFYVVDDQGNKYEALKTQLSKFDKKWSIFEKNGQGSHCGIIFTPHVNGEKGCYDLSNRLSSELGTQIGYYSGSMPKALQSGSKSMSEEAFDQFKKQMQNGYKDNEFTLLAATKAFGMGINKGNIFYTIHYGLPSSMESLYQEAGRAGRDKRRFVNEHAECLVLLTPETDTEVLDKIWDFSASLEELVDSTKQTRFGGDISTSMFMFTNSLDTINNEFTLIKKLYERYYDEGDLVRKVVSKEIGSDKSKVEKAIYRLRQLGIIADWTIENFFTGIYEVEFVKHDPSTVLKSLTKTIQKYDKNFDIGNLRQEGSKYYRYLFAEENNRKFTEIETYATVLLIWSYEHFAGNRRQSLKNVYENCNNLSQGTITIAQFKQSLENYFKFNEASYVLQHIADNPKDYIQWFNLFYDGKDQHDESTLISHDKQIQLKDQLGRFLESYMKNTGLNFISGLLRLFLNDYDDADGRNRMENALAVIHQLEAGDQAMIIDGLLNLAVHFSDDNKNALVESVYKFFNDEGMMKKFNDALGDQFSMAIIIEPQLIRLKAAIDKFQGITWQI